MVLKVATFFARCTGKQQAVKVLEEAAEVFGAWQRLRSTRYLVGKGALDEYSLHEARIELADEIADVITAACNLARRYDLDMKAAMARCEHRNMERGRL